METLLKWANELCLKHWSCSFTGHLNLTNRKWTRTNGQFNPYGFPNGKFCESAPTIEMSKKRNAERTESQVKDTLLHELVHWRLYTQKIPHRDVDKEFVSECIRVGAPISKTEKAQYAYRLYIESTETAQALAGGRNRSLRE